MGLEDAGLAYCSVLDASICRGFNPELTYLVPQTLHDHDYCIQIVKDAEMKPDVKTHSYWAYAEVCEAVFGEEGKAVCEKVLDSFAEEYGQEMADILAGYRGTNFNVA